MTSREVQSYLRVGGGEKCGEGEKEVNRINEAKGISRPRPGIVRAN